MHFIYITENFDWIHKNNLCRIYDSHEQHSYLSKRVVKPRIPLFLK